MAGPSGFWRRAVLDLYSTGRVRESGRIETR